MNFEAECGSDSRVEILEAILSVNVSAQRAVHVTRKLSTDKMTEWDRRHADLDALIDRARRAVGTPEVTQ